MIENMVSPNVVGPALRGIVTGLFASFVLATGLLLTTKKGQSRLLDYYVYIHNGVKRIKRGSQKEFIPVYSATEEKEHFHQLSLWSLNLSHIELFEYTHTEMEEVLYKGLTKFKMAYSAEHEKHNFEIDLWTIAKNEFMSIYPKKDFPKKVVIHLLPETLIFTTLPVEYNSDFTILLEEGRLNKVQIR